MGLDMYVLRITNPKLEYSLYSSDELASLSLTTCTARDIDLMEEATRQLLPYVSLTITTTLRKLLKTIICRQILILVCTLPMESKLAAKTKAASM